MITKNAMQFKAIIKKTAKDKEYLYPIIAIILFSKGDFLSPLL